MVYVLDCIMVVGGATCTSVREYAVIYGRICRPTDGYARAEPQRCMQPAQNVNVRTYKTHQCRSSSSSNYCKVRTC